MRALIMARGVAGPAIPARRSAAGRRSSITGRRSWAGSPCLSPTRSGSATSSIFRGRSGSAPDGRLPDGIEAQTRQTMENIGAILRSAGRGWDDVFHCTAMLDNMADWPAFNRVYVTYFTPGRLPARSALGADGLALGALIEVECQAYAGPATR